MRCSFFLYVICRLFVRSFHVHGAFWVQFFYLPLESVESLGGVPDQIQTLMKDYRCILCDGVVYKNVDVQKDGKNYLCFCDAKSVLESIVVTCYVITH